MLAHWAGEINRWHCVPSPGPGPGTQCQRSRQAGGPVSRCSPAPWPTAKFVDAGPFTEGRLLPNDRRHMTSAPEQFNPSRRVLQITHRPERLAFSSGSTWIVMIVPYMAAFSPASIRSQIACACRASVAFRKITSRMRFRGGSFIQQAAGALANDFPATPEHVQHLLGRRLPRPRLREHYMPTVSISTRSC